MSGGEGTIAQVLAGEARWSVTHGDCRAVMPTLGDKTVAHVITDPPYSEVTFTDTDEIVLDPFCGGGTTGVACLRLGRRFIGVELDAKYAALSTERLRAEENGQSLRDSRAGQIPMFSAT